MPGQLVWCDFVKAEMHDLLILVNANPHFNWMVVIQCIVYNCCGNSMVRFWTDFGARESPQHTLLNWIVQATWRWSSVWSICRSHPRQACLVDPACEDNIHTQSWYLLQYSMKLHKRSYMQNSPICNAPWASQCYGSVILELFHIGIMVFSPSLLHMIHIGIPDAVVELVHESVDMAFTHSWYGPRPCTYFSHVSWLVNFHYCTR